VRALTWPDLRRRALKWRPKLKVVSNPFPLDTLPDASCLFSSLSTHTCPPFTLLPMSSYSFSYASTCRLFFPPLHPSSPLHSLTPASLVPTLLLPLWNTPRRTSWSSLLSAAPSTALDQISCYMPEHTPSPASLQQPTMTASSHNYPSILLYRLLPSSWLYMQNICQLLCQLAKTHGVFMQFPATLLQYTMMTLTIKTFLRMHLVSFCCPSVPQHTHLICNAYAPVTYHT